jgi:hypothetical protein
MTSTVLPALAGAITLIGRRSGHSCAVAACVANDNSSSTPSQQTNDEIGPFRTNISLRLFKPSPA